MSVWLTHQDQDTQLSLKLTLITGAALLGCALMFILILLASRIIKSRRKKKIAALATAFQQVLNKIIMNELGDSPDPSFEFYLSELRALCGQSAFAKDVLISQIVTLKKNLTGHAATALVNTYEKLELYRETKKQLRSLRAHLKAKAIRQLAEMNHKAAVPRIRKYVHSENRLLREESQFALARLDNDPLAFLDHYHGYFSQWMHVCVHNYLRRMDSRKLPVFSRWFQSPNLSVRLFAVSMARNFRQTASVPGLVDLLYEKDPRLVAAAVSALTDLEAFQYRRQVAELAPHAWNFGRLAISVINCLARIGDPAQDAPVIEKFLSHPNYAVREKAVAALLDLGWNKDEIAGAVHDEQTVDGILRHLSEPLLQ